MAASSMIDYGALLDPGQYPSAPPSLGNPFTGMNVDYSQGNPAYAMKQNRGYAANWGTNFAGNLSQQQQFQLQLMQQYGLTAQEAGQFLAENPGYTPQEFGNIVNPDAWNGGRTSPEEFQSLNPTDEESSGMRGDTSSYASYFDPARWAGMSAINNSAQNAGSAINAGQVQGNGAIDQESNTFDSISGDPSLSPSSGYYEALAGTLSDTQSGVHGALTDTQSGLGEDLGDAVSGVRGAIDPDKLRLDLDRGRYEMSDAEVRDIEGQAGETAALSRKARYDDIARAALASGTADPMALAALRQQTDTQGASDAANARTNARIAAEDAQRGTEMNYAQAELGANQGYAGLRSSAELGLGHLRAGSDLALGGLRSNAEMGLGRFGADVAQSATDTQLRAAQQLALMRSGQAQTVGGQRLNQSQLTSQQNVQNSQDFANLYNNAYQWQGNTGTGIAMSQDQANSQRAARLYGIRQGNTQYAQQQGFQQNYLTQAQLAQLYQNAATARITGQTGTRDWATGQQNSATNAGLNLNQQQIAGFGQTVGGMNTATGQWGQYDAEKAGQGWGAQIAHGVGQMIGNMGR